MTRCMNLLGAAILMLVVVTGSGHALASNSSNSPADFGPEATSVVGMFQWPQDIQPGAWTENVWCQAIIQPSGVARDAHCIAPPDSASLSEAVLAAINAARFVPARLDGVNVSVLLNLMSVIGCSGSGECGVLWYRNHRMHDDEWGEGYSAPQAVIESDEWYKKYPEKLAWSHSDQSLSDVGGVKFVVSALVDESGRTSRRKVNFAAQYGRYDYWARDTSRALAKVRFVPGFAHNEPVKMRYFEYWVDPDGHPDFRRQSQSALDWRLSENHRRWLNRRDQGIQFDSSYPRPPETPSE